MVYFNSKIVTDRFFHKAKAAAGITTGFPQRVGKIDTLHRIVGNIHDEIARHMPHGNSSRTPVNRQQNDHICVPYPTTGCIAAEQQEIEHIRIRIKQWHLCRNRDNRRFVRNGIGTFNNKGGGWWNRQDGGSCLAVRRRRRSDQGGDATTFTGRNRGHWDCGTRRVGWNRSEGRSQRIGWNWSGRGNRRKSGSQIWEIMSRLCQTRQRGF